MEFLILNKINKMKTKSFSIKEWSEDDQPREKLILKGRNALSDAELLAILIGSGTRNQSAVELSKLVLKENGNDLNSLSKLTVNELTKFKGIGEAKAVTIVAAMELARRKKESIQEKRCTIVSSKNAFEVLCPYLNDLRHEEFYVLLVNRANEVITVAHIGKGGITGTVADIRIIMKLALDSFATGIILSHNHPSGQLKASTADINLTKNVKEAARIMQIELLDHLIIGNNAYFSFADEGLL